MKFNWDLKHHHQFLLSRPPYTLDLTYLTFSHTLGTQKSKNVKHIYLRLNIITVYAKISPVRSMQKVYKVLKDVIIRKITMKNTDYEFIKLGIPQLQQKSILELFQSENLVRRGYLKSMRIR